MDSIRLRNTEYNNLSHIPMNSIPLENLIYPGYQHIPVNKFKNPSKELYNEITRKEIEIMNTNKKDGTQDTGTFGPKKGEDGITWYKKQFSDTLNEDPLYKNTIEISKEINEDTKGILKFLREILKLPNEIINIWDKYYIPISVVMLFIIYKFLF